jgi:hypothetical protein
MLVALVPVRLDALSVGVNVNESRRRADGLVQQAHRWWWGVQQACWPQRAVRMTDNNWLQEFMETDQQRFGNRGMGGWRCYCGRFARFMRWQNTGAPGWERGYLVDCKRCGEVLVY